MTLTFSTALTVVPAARTLGAVSGSGTCIGPGMGSITWGSSAAAVTIDSSCAAIAAQVPGSITFQNVTTNVTMIAAGPTAAESWTFLDNSGTNNLQASGVFAWENTTEIDSCLGGGTLTVTLTGSFVVVT